MTAEALAQQLHALEQVLAELAGRGDAAGLVGRATPLVDGLRAAFRELHGFERELRRKAEHLARSDQRKNEFMALLSHELRNPLGAITNATHVLDRIGAQTTRAVNLRTMIVRQTQHLTRMVDDLLDVASLARGKIRLHKKAVELNALVHRSVEAVKPLVEERGHRLDLSLPPVPIWLRADPARLEHVLVILLNNASTYTEPGGHIWVAVDRDGSHAVFRVKDSGIGIHPELLPHVFDRAVPLDQALDRARKGLGVGLMLVRRLVEMHGGTVTAHSAGHGKGSEFVVSLPALPVAVERPGFVPAADQPMSHLRVLIVEDDADAAKSLAMLLRLKGCDVRVARDGPAALTTAKAEPPDVILLDIGLPGMDGYQVAQELRQQPELEKTRLVAITGYAQDDDRQRSREAGFEHHLVKPVEPEALQELLLQTT
jgi:two-component system CheB/CheR fusion protein